jgi:hypothetical protein
MSRWAWIMIGMMATTGCVVLDSDAGEGGSSSSTATAESTVTTAAADSSSGGPPVGDGSSSGGEGLVWPPDDGINTCTQECEGPWDCCPASAMDQCPGAYPFNFACLYGFCVPASCESSAECAEGESCELVDSVPRCVTVCADDDGCAATAGTLTCGAMTDEGASYCIDHCAVSGTFCGNATCDPDSGRCVCEAGQCLAGWSCV